MNTIDSYTLGCYTFFRLIETNLALYMVVDIMVPSHSVTHKKKN